jgi:hypothetical protein
MKRLPSIFTLVGLLAGTTVGISQGFVNLDFESANASGYSSGTIPTTNAIPGWTAYISGVAQSSILYDDETLSDPAISLQDTNGIYSPIQGSHSVLLQGQFNPTHNSIYTNSVAIGQTGLIPTLAETLIFSANITVGGPYLDNMQLTFNGQNLGFTQIGSGANFTIYGANISPFAGQTGQLLFSVPYNGGVLLDNIQFSSLPVPEPSGLPLAILGAGLIGWLRWKKSRTGQ